MSEFVKEGQIAFFCFYADIIPSASRSRAWNMPQAYIRYMVKTIWKKIRHRPSRRADIQECASAHFIKPESYRRDLIENLLSILYQKKTSIIMHRHLSLTYKLHIILVGVHLIVSGYIIQPTSRTNNLPVLQPLNDTLKEIPVDF